MFEPVPVSLLSQYPTAIVSDAMDELGIAGVITGVHPQRIGQGRITGRALPVRLEPKRNDPRPTGSAAAWASRSSRC